MMYYDPDFVRENMHYDPATGVLTWAAKKGRRVLGKPIGYLDKDGYLVVRRSINGLSHGPKKTYIVHRICWVWAYGKLPDNQIDHINGNKSDNRLCNLREASVAENARNVSKRSNNTSGIKGVFKNKRLNKWYSQIRIDKKVNYLGLFDCPAAASMAYQIAADVFHGSYARQF